MKTIKLFALVGIFSLLLTPTALFSEQINADDHPNYVVIGAFSIHQNAIRFTSHAHNDLNMPAHFELNKDRKLYYVYVLSTLDRNHAIKVAMKLRNESEFTDTWVYSGDLGMQTSADGNPSKGVDINPVTQQKINSITSNEQKEDQKNASASEMPSDANLLPARTENPATAKNAEEKSSESKTSTGSKDADEVEGKTFVFKIYRGVDNEPVEGDVDAVDSEKARKLASYKGNAPVKVSSPPGTSGNLSLVCDVFGYRKVQREINYNAPEGEDIEKDDQGNIVVPFELIRLQKGDIAVMYNVYFYKDAAVMRPESRYEVSSLHDMMKENPKYKIKIHGHTNGGASGKIIQKAKESDNFFSLSQTTDSFGSAKKLSQERAQIIKDYLISVGIDPSRMIIKAWGGKRPIHDKHHSRAQENVRVEIEILEDK
jgi:outer membrane protein OmpA-like peptidoglycan-associated protein